ncbi:MAG: argininosuccinate synthase [Planctomycetota bacterium]
MAVAALAFSGGLDTSYAVLALKRAGHDVVTVTVDTGGFSKQDLKDIQKRSRALGSLRHESFDCRRDVYKRFFRYLLFGNVLRGGVYPVAVGAERYVQAEKLVEAAEEQCCKILAHGCTAAGNDQVRFDASFAALAPGLPVLAPVRDKEVSREESTAVLREAGIEIPPKTTKYSINAGLVGATVGGGATHDPWEEIPEEAWAEAGSVLDPQAKPVDVTIHFHKGVPSGDLHLFDELNQMAAPLGVGRGVHLGETVLGLKGRIGFVAPAATILITAHRELEKLVLTKRQSDFKNAAGAYWGDLLHEGLYYDPVARDIESVLESSQGRVTGDVKLRLRRGAIEVIGVQSPHSLMDAAGAAKYGEESPLWDGRDAAGFGKIHGLAPRLWEEAE